MAPSLFRSLAHALHGAAALAWPARCWVCGVDTAGPSACSAHDVEPGLRGPRCGVCAGPLPAGARSGHRCAECRRSSRAFRTTVAALDYGDPAVREWILRFKHGGRVDLAVPLADFVRRALCARGIGLSRGDWLVPVPLHAARRLERGYDQAARLAAEIVRLTGARAVPALVRTRATAPQGDDLGPARARNVRVAFACRAPRLPPGGRYWVVDDVLTSGATADACARALKGAGAREVGVLALARAAGPGDGGPGPGAGFGTRKAPLLPPGR